MRDFETYPAGDLEELLRRNPAAEDGRPLPDIAAAASAAGLVDVAYTTDEFSIGPLLLATTPRGLVRLAYLGEDGEDEVLDELATRVSPRILAVRSKLDPIRRELEEFFAGVRRHFDVSLDWQLTGGGFARRVLAATNAIPYGAVSSYKQVASEAGSPHAARAAGNALGANPLPIVVPCHRVLHTGGGLGGYTGGLERKRLLLTLEGVLTQRLA